MRTDAVLSGGHPRARLIVFDIDGTLADSRVQILAAMSAAFAFVDLPAPPPADMMAIVGLSLPEAMAALQPRATDAVLAALVAGYKAAYGRDRGLAGPSPLYPGARALLDRLAARSGTRLAIATGKTLRGLDHLLDFHGIAGHFASVQTADSHPSKPDPAMLRAALAQTGTDASDAVMIGDTSFDIAMGRAAGVHTIAVTWGFHDRARLAAAGPENTVDDFAALAACLAEQGEGLA